MEAGAVLVLLGPSSVETSGAVANSTCSAEFSDLVRGVRRRLTATGHMDLMAVIYEHIETEGMAKVRRKMTMCSPLLIAAAQPATRKPG